MEDRTRSEKERKDAPRWETERRREEKDREMGTERKGTEGQNERSQNGDREKLTITLQESADPRGQHCYLHYWYLENRPSSLSISLAHFAPLFPSAIAIIRDTVFSKWYFHSCASSQPSSKFSRAARTRERAVSIFSPSVPRNRYHRTRHTIQCV